MLKYGTNIIQAIGYFSGMLILLLLAMDGTCILVYTFYLYFLPMDNASNLIFQLKIGNYMIAIAFMSKVTTPCSTRMDDYVHPVIEKLASGKQV